MIFNLQSFLLITIIYKMESQQDYEFPFEEKDITELYKEYSHKRLLQYLENPVIDRALGCLFGSFIGDALGAYLQFIKQVNKFNEMLQKVMSMPGGGVFQIRPGQVTDDSELAFHLLRVLADSFCSKTNFAQSNDSIILNISKGYLEWRQSGPFDIGITIKKAIQAIRLTFLDYQINKNTQLGNLGQESAKKLSIKIHENVKKSTISSQSNGSLMRIAPMPFFFGIVNSDKYFRSEGYLNKSMSLTKQIMKKFIKEQTSLLHGNQENVEVSYRWVTMLLAIIKRPDNHHLKDIFKYCKRDFQKIINLTSLQIDARQNIGWVKIAVTLGLASLNRIIDRNSKLDKDLYKQQIFTVVSKGGDTDTNAAIVGGLLGALIGFKNLPKEYIEKMMKLRHNNPKQKKSRPQFYEPRRAFLNAYKIIDLFAQSPQYK